MSTPAGDAVARLVRDQYPRILATLIRVTGDVTAAQDAVQDAVVRAVHTWPRNGIPQEPRAWLVVVARRCAVDRARREAGRRDREAQATWLAEQDGNMSPSVVRDDLLRLIFTCCHPSLSRPAQVALSLRTLGGLSTAEVARALLVPEQTMAKRLTRAKQKIRQAHIPYRIPADDELPARRSAVLATIYLIFNEGYSPASGSASMRPVLMEEASRLGALLLEVMPDEASVQGLVALMTLQRSRRTARSAADGSAVPLADQDRRRWDADAIRRGVVLTGAALHRTPDRPDPYVIQAAIAACHALAPSYRETPWDAIISWYDVLLTVQDSPTARLGWASALAERDGAAAGLMAVQSIGGLEQYPWWHAARAELLGRLHRHAEALAARDRAKACGLNQAQLITLDRSLLL